MWDDDEVTEYNKYFREKLRPFHNAIDKDRKAVTLSNLFEAMEHNAELHALNFFKMLECMLEDGVIERPAFAPTVKYCALRYQDAKAVLDAISLSRKAAEKGDYLMCQHHAALAGYFSSEGAAADIYPEADLELEKYIRTKGLDKGRSSANALKAENAGRKIKRLTNAIENLYRNGEGYKMTYPKMATHLARHGFSYAPSTMLKHVKNIAPKLKEQFAKK